VKVMLSPTPRPRPQGFLTLLAAGCCLVLMTGAAGCGRESAAPDASKAPAAVAAPSAGREGATPPQAPPPAPPPAAYKTIENALTKAGLKVCSFTGYGENQDYAYLEARQYYVSRGACVPGRPPVEGNARFGTVRVEIYLNSGTLKRGIEEHQQETRYEQPVSGAAWILDETIVEIPRYVHPAMAQAVARAMRALPAKRQYFRFR
jgi:hypothetical protein